MIERDGLDYYLICDVCGDAVIFGSFGNAVEFKKDDGWKSQKHNGEWEDVCPECRKEENNVQKAILQGLQR